MTAVLPLRQIDEELDDEEAASETASVGLWMRVPMAKEKNRIHPGFELFVALNAESLPASFRLPVIGTSGAAWEKVLSTGDKKSDMEQALESGAVVTVEPNSLVVWQLTASAGNGSRPDQP